jgi:hypothetical protein
LSVAATLTPVLVLDMVEVVEPVVVVETVVVMLPVVVVVAEPPVPVLVVVPLSPQPARIKPGTVSSAKVRSVVDIGASIGSL